MFEFPLPFNLVDGERISFMIKSATIVDDNVAYLRQGEQLIAGLDVATYTHSAPPLYTSGIGGHLRHCIDHYIRFLDGLPGRQIDYNQRDRDAHIESDPMHARQVIQALIERLESLAEVDLDQPVQSMMDCGRHEEANFAASSVCRELQFLISHTVHHYALIAMILRHQGEQPPADFGVAPSTIQYRENQSSCAR